MLQKVTVPYLFVRFQLSIHRLYIESGILQDLQALNFYLFFFFLL